MSTQSLTREKQTPGNSILWEVGAFTDHLSEIVSRAHSPGKETGMIIGFEESQYAMCVDRS